MQRNPNKGLGSLYWSIIITVLVLFVLAGVLWWYDAKLIPGH
ncbi:hypothetical protein [Alicyclobacillus sp. SO9]|nr:hypothetical protein [Alicyclobacillus sp. SO9]